MANSVTFAVCSVLCLILIQNLVSSKPAPVPEEPQAAVPVDPPANVAPTALPANPSEPEKSKTPEVPEKPAVVTTQVTETTVKDAGTPKAQASGDKKDGKGGSAVVYANFGLLVVTASVLMRL